MFGDWGFGQEQVAFVKGSGLANREPNVAIETGTEFQ